MTVAKASDGPGLTLVVDLHERGGLGPRSNLMAELIQCRQSAMALDGRLGAKTIAVVGCSDGRLDLLFVQGNGTEIDPLSEVCLNSAAAAAEVACVHWALLPVGLITVCMGDFCIELEPVVE